MRQKAYCVLLAALILVLVFAGCSNPPIPPVPPVTTGNIYVNATYNGARWAGPVSYQVNGPFTDTEDNLPWSFNGVEAGVYSITYNYGGPSGATLANVTPAPAQQLSAGGTVSFTLNFQTPGDSRINVSATLDGVPWNGGIDYTIYGPFQDRGTMVPTTNVGVEPGSYTVVYNDGGPQNAVFTGISPSASQTLASNGQVDFTLNFSSAPSASSLSVTAYFNGGSWTGPVNYSISGPVSGSYTSVPLKLPNVPDGTYRISYKAGGPAGASLGGIIPDTTLVVSGGRAAEFTFTYYTQSQSGNVIVQATLDGSPWYGSTSFSLSNPFLNVDYSVPRTYSSVPTGVYTVTYLGGGPSNATLTGITLAPTQSLAAGRTIVFSLNFTSKQDTGNITIYARVDGQPWVTNPGSGPISYSLTNGSLMDSEDTIPSWLTGYPTGNYTLVYDSGGPVGSTLTGISPSPTQYLPAGGSIAYILNFTAESRGYVTVDATLNGQSWYGSANYVLHGPYVQTGNTVAQTFDGAPQGTYSVDFRDGGPWNAEFAGVSPSSQYLSPGGSLEFTLMFTSLPGPGPMPGPVPNPTPGPMPGPVPNPTPEPMPGPVPNPTPEPMPGPVPNPTPEPMPGPVPNPTPEPMPGPLNQDLSP
ncbi:MAG: hypothetical protein ABSG90_10200 [Dehalococcoidia bacterium]